MLNAAGLGVQCHLAENVDTKSQLSVIIVLSSTEVLQLCTSIPPRELCRDVIVSADATSVCKVPGRGRIARCGAG